MIGAGCALYVGWRMWDSQTKHATATEHAPQQDQDQLPAEARRRGRGRDAVLIIDLQVDYISGGDLVAGQTSSLIQAFPDLPANVAALLESARAQGAVVGHVRQIDSVVKSKWLPWWDKLHPGGVGAGVAAVAEPWAAERAGEPVFTKATYDAFLGGAVTDELLAFLEAQGVSRIYFAGALTKACVMFSANSAFTYGFEVRTCAAVVVTVVRVCWYW